MKKSVWLVAAVAALAIAFSSCASSGLPDFGAELGAQSNPVPGMDSIRVPYQSLTSFYGYVQPGAAPDETVDGKKMFYLYLWIPLVAPEVGIRMISPVPSGVEPKEGDIVDAAYEAGKSDKENYFDTWVTIQRSATVIDPAGIAGAASSKWIPYDSNDDSSELPAQPSGNKYNSVLRIVVGDDPLKTLIRGLYRIGFTTYKVGEVQGTFLAQVGAPIDLPGVAIARTLADLAKTAK